MQVPYSQCRPLVIDALKAGLVPMITSSPGVGKSAMLRSIAQEYNLKYNDMRLSQMEPIDLLGLPAVDPDDKSRSTYLPSKDFLLEGDPVPAGYGGMLLALDEMSSAKQDTQAAAYRLILDRQVGNRNLHSKVLLAAAGNLMTDKAVVNRLSTAMQSRIVHLEVAVDYPEWRDWADKNDLDYRVKAYLAFRPAMLHSFDPNHQDKTFPCPRTWEFMSKLCKPMKSISTSKFPLFKGTIGEGASREFMAFVKVMGDIPTIENILANPEGISISSEPSVQYALAGQIGEYLNATNANQLMKYLSRMGVDFQVMALRSAIAKSPEIKSHPAIRQWITQHAREMSTN